MSVLGSSNLGEGYSAEAGALCQIDKHPHLAQESGKLKKNPGKIEKLPSEILLHASDVVSRSGATRTNYKIGRLLLSSFPKNLLWPTLTGNIQEREL